MCDGAFSFWKCALYALELGGHTLALALACLWCANALKRWAERRARRLGYGYPSTRREIVIPPAPPLR